MQESNKFSKFIPAFAVILFFVGFGLWAKFGPAIPISVSSVTTAQPTPFTVSTEGKVNAKPDTVTVNVGFQTVGDTVKSAQDEANVVVNRVSSAIKLLGINEKDIRTTNYSIYPEEQQTPLTEQPTIMIAPEKPTTFPLKKITKYRVNISLQITVRDFAKVNRVIDSATNNGANQINGVYFEVENIDEFRSQARQIAIDKAKKKASEIARQSGINLGKIINVSDGYSNYQPQQLMATAEVGRGGGGVPTQIEAGSSEVVVTVTLSYETR